jgi:hypothetical protein
MVSAVNGPLYTVYSPKSSSKVLIMSNHSRRRHVQETTQVSQSLFSKVEQEMNEGYMEVEVTGITLRRLSIAYLVMLRAGWSYALGSVRSLLRPTPAH